MGWHIKDGNRQPGAAPGAWTGGAARERRRALLPDVPADADVHRRVRRRRGRPRRRPRPRIRTPTRPPASRRCSRRLKGKTTSAGTTSSRATAAPARRRRQRRSRPVAAARQGERRGAARAARVDDRRASEAEEGAPHAWRPFCSRTRVTKGWIGCGLIVIAVVALAARASAARTAIRRATPRDRELPDDRTRARPALEVELQLRGLLDAAAKRGYPIKVSLIASEGDTGGEAAPLGTPQRYAECVGRSSRASAPLRAPMLIVTPNRIAVAGRQLRDGRADSPSSRPDARALVRGVAVAGAARTARPWRGRRCRRSGRWHERAAGRSRRTSRLRSRTSRASRPRSPTTAASARGRSRWSRAPCWCSSSCSTPSRGGRHGARPPRPSRSSRPTSRAPGRRRRTRRSARRRGSAQHLPARPRGRAWCRGRSAQRPTAGARPPRRRA